MYCYQYYQVLGSELGKRYSFRYWSMLDELETLNLIHRGVVHVLTPL